MFIAICKQLKLVNYIWFTPSTFGW